MLCVLLFALACTPARAQQATQAQIDELCANLATFSRQAALARDRGVSRSAALTNIRQNLAGMKAPKGLKDTIIGVTDAVYDRPTDSVENLSRETFDACKTKLTTSR